MTSSGDRNAPQLQRSQLRRLAREFYADQVSEAEYRRRRRTLIDGIVDGDVQIQRERPPQPPPPVSPSPPPAAVAPAVAPAVQERFSPLHVAVGLAVVAALATAGWLVWPDGGPDRSGVAPLASATDAPRIPPRTISEARTVVELFLAARDWSQGAIDGFEARWNALPEAEREDARTASWFRNLTKAVRDELKTQKALAEFDQTGSATAAGERLAAFRDRLGAGDSAPRATRPPVTPAAAPATVEPLAGQLPPTEPVPAPAPAPAPEPPAPEPPAAVAPIASVEPGPVTPAVPRPAPGSQGGNAWLAAQPASAFTLQLFALNHLDRIERLMNAYPSVRFRVVATEDASPRYRVLLGSYAREADARAAHAALPEGVRSGQPAALVKSFGELRGSPAPLPAATAPATAGDWLARAGRDQFTVQLFASDRRESVEQLVAGNPGVDLRIVHTRAGRSLYRVLHGVYSSTAAAIAAAGALPATLLRSTGKPLVKSVAELQDARDG